MDDESLRFPDAPRSELESTIKELVERADDVLTTQGRLRSLLLASRIVVEDLDLERVLRRIVEAAVALVDAQYGALGVLDSDGHLDRFIHVGMSADVAEQIGHLPEGHGVLRAVIDSDEPIRLDDLSADPRSAGFPAHHPPMHSFLGVPIRIRDEAYGNLYLTNHAEGPFTREDEELVTALAGTAAIAIDNARLYEESRRRQRLSTALSEITATLLAPESGEVFGVVVERVASLVDADLVAIVVPGAADGELRVDTARGIGAETIEGSVLPADETLVARAIADGHIVSSHDGADAPPFGERLTVGPTIAVPLVVSGEAVGALCVSRSVSGPAFSTVDLATVSEFAAQAGLAVALAWARADRQRLDVIEDRARIARDLHDHVIQRLFGTGLGLQALAAADPAHAEAIDGHVAEIDAAIADIRTAIFALQTSASESARDRLLNVVAELTPSLAAPPRVTFAGPVDLIVIGSLADDVVAVVREALTNIARHADADTAAVDITVTASDITVTVDDDGVGVPPKVADHASGIANLDARARLHGGDFALEPRHPGGTRARWRVPLPSLPDVQR